MAKIVGVSPTLAAALSGLGIDVRNATRIIIDIRWDHVPVIHVEMLGDTESLEAVTHQLDGVEIVHCGRKEGE